MLLIAHHPYIVPLYNNYYTFDFDSPLFCSRELDTAVPVGKIIRCINKGPMHPFYQFLFVGVKSHFVLFAIQNFNVFIKLLEGGSDLSYTLAL